MTSLLLATSNPGKIAEMRTLLGDIPFDLVTSADLGLDLDVEEPYHTYLENATVKARAYAEASGVLALADDSGLEVDALDGEPGVFSARFGGPDLPYAKRFGMIEQRLVGVVPERRTARFRAVLVLAEPPPGTRVASTEGVVEGVIVATPRGSAGFGYDPILFVPELGRTMAELTPDEKNRISHRGHAARAMAAKLRRWPDVW